MAGKVAQKFQATFNTLRPGQNFQMKMFEFWIQFDCCLFLRAIWQQYSIGSDNGLAQNRRQAIIWTNDGIG